LFKKERGRKKLTLKKIVKGFQVFESKDKKVKFRGKRISPDYSQPLRPLKRYNLDLSPGITLIVFSKEGALLGISHLIPSSGFKDELLDDIKNLIVAGHHFLLIRGPHVLSGLQNNYIIDLLSYLKSIEIPEENIYYHESEYYEAIGKDGLALVSILGNKKVNPVREQRCLLKPVAFSNGVKIDYIAYNSFRESLASEVIVRSVDEPCQSITFQEKDKIGKAVRQIEVDERIENYERVKPGIEKFLRRFVNPDSEDGKRLLLKLKDLRVVPTEKFARKRKYIAVGTAAVILIPCSIFGIYPLFTGVFTLGISIPVTAVGLLLDTLLLSAAVVEHIR